jgi:hypothetical protein
MNDKEKMEFYIAMCKCCLLAEVMKNCPQCQFNIGLAEQVKLGEAIPVQIFEQPTVFAMAE